MSPDFPPGSVISILPWDDDKRCPKCNHPNLAGARYYAATTLMPEHLRVQCYCGYMFFMETKR